jgi:hypothetical protein
MKEPGTFVVLMACIIGTGVFIVNGVRFLIEEIRSKKDVRGKG